MPVQEVVGTARILVILNAGSGNSAPETVVKTLEQQKLDSGLEFEVRKLDPECDLQAIVKAAIAQGVDLVVAAGGDGTVSSVAQALVGTTAKLGIIPLGTTNVLARELGIPLDLTEACRLLAGPRETAEIDAMRVGDAHYFTQIGVGVDAYMIRDTTDANKKRFGPLAYLWTGGIRLAGFQPRRFSIAVDDQRDHSRASQVMLINSGALGTSGLRWTPDSRVDDGRIEVCIVRARTVWHYMAVAWSFIRFRPHEQRQLRFMAAERVVTVSADKPVPVQADGEVIGTTPIEMRVVPRALRVAIPATQGVH